MLASQEIYIHQFVGLRGLIYLGHWMLTSKWIGRSPSSPFIGNTHIGTWQRYSDMAPIIMASHSPCQSTPSLSSLSLLLSKANTSLHSLLIRNGTQKLLASYLSMVILIPSPIEEDGSLDAATMTVQSVKLSHLGRKVVSVIFSIKECSKSGASASSSSSSKFTTPS